MAYDRTNPGTMLDALINPQVLAEYLDVKLMKAIKFAPLCNINTELQGRPGSKLTLPQYTFIGLAKDVKEGEDVEFGNLGYRTVDVEIKKAGRGVKITDEAILSAYGNPVDEIAKQLLMAIAGRVDEDCITVFRNGSINLTHGETDAELDTVQSVDGKEFGRDMIIDMIAKFGEDIEEDMTLLVNPQHLAALRKDDAFIHVMDGQAIMSGEIGQIYGCRVVVSNKVQENEAFLVKAGAVEILMKRNVAVEADRDIVNKTNIFVVDEHYAVYLKDATKLVRATNVVIPK
jgi:N4-gp56 family major capsid protein